VAVGLGGTVSGGRTLGVMRVSVCQLNSREDRADNLAVARDLLGRAAAAGAELAVLPEYVDYLGPGKSAPKPEPIDGEFAAFFSEAARELGIWVHAGSFHEAGPDETRTYNTTLLFDPAGERVAVYRKIHLYDVEIAGRVSYQESRSVAPGSETVVTEIGGIPTGLSICYDLRFPELYRRLAIDGAKILVVPAAFMMHTGRDHWEVLLRARAIENQAYVVGCNRVGSGGGLDYAGDSCIVDPLGELLATAAGGETVLSAEVDAGRVADVRDRFRFLADRR